MTEVLQTRTEHSRSVADAEKYKALEVLKDVGLLIPLSELETYHGREWANDQTEEWEVDPTFSNGSNDSGNYNVNNRPTLYTAEHQVAQDFADKRAGFKNLYHSHLWSIIDGYGAEEKQEQLARQNAHLKHLWEERGEAGNLQEWDIEELEKRRSFVEVRYLKEKLGQDYYEKFKQQYEDRMRGDVHEIVSTDTDACVLDLTFDSQILDDTSRVRYQQALRVLAIPMTEGSPIAFEDRDALPQFVAAMRELKAYIVTSDVVGDLAKKAGLDEVTAIQLASAWNARQIVQTDPKYLVNRLINNAEDIAIGMVSIDNGPQEAPLNLEYVQRYLRLNHIVGVRQPIYSATLGRSIDSVSLFDLEKVSTVEGLAAERGRVAQRLGAIASSVGGLLRSEVHTEEPILRLLDDPHAKPEDLVAKAREVDGFEQLFAADAGNWEGFTLAEHTETVLRNFDETYADKVPVSLIAPMRLVILAHDLGKPISAAQGRKHEQTQFNVQHAREFYKSLGLDERLSTLLTAVLGRGEELAFQVNVRRGGEYAEQELQNFATETLREVYGSDVSPEQIDGFIELCSMLQVCDGGAYTSMAVTRKEKGGRYRNAPSFNASFAQPVGFGKRGIRLRGEQDKPAAANLAPRPPKAEAK